MKQTFRSKLYSNPNVAPLSLSTHESLRTEFRVTQYCDTLPPSIYIILLWRCDPTRVMASSFLMFLDHTQRRITAGRTPLDEWSARRRDLYLTTQNTHNRQTSMPPVGFEPTISARFRPQTCAIDRAATGTGLVEVYRQILCGFLNLLGAF